jgi:hypothetical protein
VQSPWVIDADGGSKQIMKRECYVFDFALDRALKEISDYSCQLDINGTDPEKKVSEFIDFLPVLAYDGSSMVPISAADVLDIAMAGTSATLLAKRWESALLVNVDNGTLQRLMNCPEAMVALEKIEGFRSLNSDIKTIINKSEDVRKAKKEGSDNLTPQKKKELTEEEKEYKSKRKQIQEKLIKFATRIPIFMYLTDYRERCLKDVITQLEPNLFKRVTGLDVKDFNLLLSLGVFNGPLMNDAVSKFRRYEDSSLNYTGIDMHENEDVGLWDTTITHDEYLAMASQQQDSMTPLAVREDDFPEEPAEIAPDDDKEETKEENRRETVQNTQYTASPFTRAQPKKVSVALRPNRSSVRMFGSEQQKQKINVSSIKAGTILKHKIFGEGTVRKITDGKIFVMFGRAEKTFIFPDVFEQGFLKLI